MDLENIIIVEKSSIINLKLPHSFVYFALKVHSASLKALSTDISVG
jgi:hypothetical protein